MSPPPLRGGMMTQDASYPRVALRSTRGHAPAPLRGKTPTTPPISSRTRRDDTSLGLCGQQRGSPTHYALDVIAASRIGYR